MHPFADSLSRRTFHREPQTTALYNFRMHSVLRARITDSFQVNRRGVTRYKGLRPPASVLILLSRRLYSSPKLFQPKVLSSFLVFVNCTSSWISTEFLYIKFISTVQIIFENVFARYFNPYCNNVCNMQVSDNIVERCNYIRKLQFTVRYIWPSICVNFEL